MKLKEHYAKYKMMVGHQAIIAWEKIPKHSFVGDDFPLLCNTIVMYYYSFYVPG